MIADLRRYPAMKDSGVPWLGEVPEHWGVLPNRAIFDEIKERDRPDADMLSVTITKGVIRQQALLEDSSKKDSSKLDRSAYKFVRPGDIAYNKMRAWQGAVGVSEHEGIVSPAYVVQRPREGAAPRYVHYLLRTPAFAKEAERWSYGITSDMWSLRPEHFKLIYSCLPPLTEQAAIVRFLDHADRRIRRYIRAKQKLIKLLEEQKQAIIHRAVTRGLDPNVCLKPSGVEWLGDVPEHWEVRRIASFSPKITNGWVGPTRDILRDEGVPYVQSLHVKRGMIRFAKRYFVDRAWLNARPKICLREGDVVVVQTGDIGQVACIPPEFDGAGCHALIIIRTDPKVMSGRFLDLVLRSRYGFENLKSLQTGALHPHLNCTWVREILVPVPPGDEQNMLLQSTGNATASLARAVANAEAEIDLLGEYRTRLIADVVTGKLDVREAAARLPDEADDPEPLDEIEAESDTDEPGADDTDAVPEEAEA